jgi:hypothetical protein
MAKIQGSTQSVDISLDNGSTWESLICLRTSSVNGTVDSTVEQTNCGTFTSIGKPNMTIDFDAICETAPTSEQVSYSALLTAFNAGTQIVARVQNPVVSGSSAGASYYHKFDGYVTSLTLNQSTTEFINFSGTISSNGAIDIDPA